MPGPCWKSARLAVEYAGRGIRINAICPSFAGTPMVTGMLGQMRGGEQEAKARLLSAVPMRRIAEPEEIVGAVLFLASRASAMVTGHTLAVDGGYLAQ